MQDLKSTVDLLTSITFFRMKVKLIFFSLFRLDFHLLSIKKSSRLVRSSFAFSNVSSWSSKPSVQHDFAVVFLLDDKQKEKFLLKKSIFFFKVQELSSPPRASAVVKDCVKNCITHTFDFLFANCDEVYKRESKQQTNSTENPSDQQQSEEQATTSLPTTVVTPSLKSLEFWHQLMYLLSRIISEDRERYGLVLNQFVFFSTLFSRRK